MVEVGIFFIASDATIIRKIIVPATLPYIMTGLLLSVGRSFIGMVVAEYFTAITGLGGIILKAGDDFDTAPNVRSGDPVDGDGRRSDRPGRLV